MKTIEQAAKENSEKAGYNPKKASDIVCKTVYECAFKEGVKFAQQWISVEKEIPANDENVLMQTEEAGVVFGKFKDIALICSVTHWRPIYFL